MLASIRPSFLRAAAVAATFAATVAFSDAPTTTIPAGSTINAQLTSADINTKSAKDGDNVTLQVVPPYPGSDANLQGASIHGHVASVRPASQGRKAVLSLAFDSITFSNGRNVPLSGNVLKMDSKSDSTAARKGLGAGVGAAIGSQTIGRILGGTLGSVVGIAGGAAAGYAYGANDKANFDVATGSKVLVQTASGLVVPRRQSGQGQSDSSQPQDRPNQSQSQDDSGQ